MSSYNHQPETLHSRDCIYLILFLYIFYN